MVKWYSVLVAYVSICVFTFTGSEFSEMLGNCSSHCLPVGVIGA